MEKKIRKLLLLGYYGGLFRANNRLYFQDYKNKKIYRVGKTKLKPEDCYAK